ncbi:MAG TPA: multicopper oxidase domain-containing protein [Gemmatimonadales bacterium]|nr:multicopper oxidase domain-containing protein [Gemmatimonadales bacterium]
MPDARSPAPPRAEPNDQRTPAGHLVGGQLRVDLEVVQAAWYPRGADGPRILTPAFAEVGRAPQVPGPFLRASAGTPIHVTLHNTLDRPIAVRGLLDRATMAPVRRPPALALAVLPAFAFAEPLVIAPGETGEATFTPTEAVSSFYYATTLPPGAPPSAVAASAVPRLREGALMGALVVDPRGSPRPKGERVLMITRWNAPGENDTWKMMVNGESWPFTEHLQYTVGDTVHWRVINASDIDHPMHLHGFYFTVNTLGDTQHDTLFTVDPPQVVTQMMQEYSAMRVSWVASRPGDWLFHCHLIQHIGESQHLVGERAAHAGAHAHAAGSDEDPMAGLVVGITIHPAPGTRVADKPPVRTIELWTGRRPNVYGSAPELGFVIQQGATPPPLDSTRVPGTPLILTRGQPTAIVIHNRLRFPFSVHWHGLEIRSLYDGVPGWSGMPGATMPPIAPGDSVRVILTQPRAGTFIYHTHGEPGYELSQGLYGPLLVLPPGETWDRTHDRIFTLASHGATFGAAPAINGRVWPEPERFDVGATYRLRFIQISADEFKRIRLLRDGKAVMWRPIAKDGRDLPASRSRIGAATTGMGVGETRDFAWTPREPGVYVLEVTTEFYPRFGGTAVQRMAFGVGDVSDAELRRAQQPAIPFTRLTTAERARYIGTFTGRPNAPGAPELVVRIWEENHRLHGTFPTPKAASGGARSGRLLAIGKDSLAVGRDLDGLAHLLGPKYRFSSGSGTTLDELDVEAQGQVLVRLTRVPDDPAPKVPRGATSPRARPVP